MSMNTNSSSQNYVRQNSSVNARQQNTPPSTEKSDNVGQLLENAGIKGSDDVKALQGISLLELNALSPSTLYGTKADQIAPPSAPQVDWSPELKMGVESFVNNLSTVVDDIFTSTAAATASNVDVKGDPNADVTQNPDQNVKQVNTDPPEASATTAMPENAVAVGGNTLIGRPLDELSAELLLAMFLKLNIDDPNNSVETQNELSELSTRLRQQGIKDALAKSKQAQKESASAQAYASQVETISNIITVVSIAMMAFTFGTSAMATQGLNVAKEGAIQGAVKPALQKAAVSIPRTMGDVAMKTSADMAAKGGGEATKELAISTYESNLRQNLVDSGVKDTLKKEILASKDLAGKGLTGEALDQAADRLADEAIDQLVENSMANLSDAAFTDLAAGNSATALAEIGQMNVGAITSDIGVQTVARESGLTQLADSFNTTSSQAMVDNTRSATIGLQVVNAGAQYEAANKMNSAKEAQLGVKRSRFAAEQQQQIIEQENEIIQAIMESKNKTVDAVMKMMNAAFATNNKVISSSMSR